MRSDYSSYKEVKIGVYNILKNEGHFIQQYCNSMKEADFIYLLDTGSTDGSYQILQRKSETEKFKGKLFVHQQVIKPWRFDVARNVNLEMIPTPEQGGPDVLISVDLDETLTEGWADEIRKIAFEHPNFDRIWYKYAWSHDENGEPGRVFWYDKIHQNDKGWKWKAPVHEFLDYDGTKSYEGCYRMNQDVIWLHHWPDQTKSRGSYLELLELRAKEMPEDIYGLCYLVREYQFYSRWEDSLKTAIQVYTKAMRDCPGQKDVLTSIARDIASMFDKVGLPDEAEFFFKKAIEYEPRLKDNYIMYAQFLAYHGKPLQALEQLKLSKQNAVRLYDWREIDYMWSYWKELQIQADAYCWLGQYPFAYQLIKAAQQFITTDKDKREALQEGLYSDYQFIEGKIKDLTNSQ